MRLKSKAVVIPTIPTEYPSGICVSVDGNYYYINGKYRHPVIGTRILESWRFPFVVKTSEEALTNYPRAAKLGFRDGSLVKDISNGTIYIISQRLKRPIHNPDVLTTLGLTNDNARWVSKEELSLHKTGEVLK